MFEEVLNTSLNCSTADNQLSVLESMSKRISLNVIRHVSKHYQNTVLQLRPLEFTIAFDIHYNFTIVLRISTVNSQIRKSTFFSFLQGKRCTPEKNRHCAHSLSRSEFSIAQTFVEVMCLFCIRSAKFFGQVITFKHING